MNNTRRRTTRISASASSTISRRICYNRFYMLLLLSLNRNIFCNAIPVISSPASSSTTITSNNKGSKNNPTITEKTTLTDKNDTKHRRKQQQATKARLATQTQHIDAILNENNDNDNDGNNDDIIIASPTQVITKNKNTRTKSATIKNNADSNSDTTIRKKHKNNKNNESRTNIESSNKDDDTNTNNEKCHEEDNTKDNNDNNDGDIGITNDKINEKGKNDLVVVVNNENEDFNQPPSPSVTSTNDDIISPQQQQQAHLLRHEQISYQQKEDQRMEQNNRNEIQKQNENQQHKVQKSRNIASSNAPKDKIIKEKKIQNQKNDNYFLEWSRNKLGIRTSNIKIDYFYYNTTSSSTVNTNSSSVVADDDCDGNNLDLQDDDDDDDEVNEVIEPIRGLAATKNISIGEKILSIPFQSTITISTIHKDPVLSIILEEYAPKFKQQQQQETELNSNNVENEDNNNNNDNDDNRYSELYQLIIYLLYQRSLGRASIIKPYIDMLLKTPYDTIPFLWSTDKLHTIYPDQNHIVRITTDYILNDIQEMYDDHIPTLIELYPEIFANKHTTTTTNNNNDEDNNSINWMFSLENFKWAYFLLNSRHWHLPCQDLDHLLQNLPSQSSTAKKSRIKTTSNNKSNTVTNNDIVQQQQHILMVPVADLINFGPACTKALYNSTTHAFEIIATCNITKDSEITFWYTNDCKDIVYANFGFTHELIPSCPTIQDYKERNIRLVDKLKDLQDELVQSWEYVDQLKLVIVEMQRLLKECDCDTTITSNTNNSNNDDYSNKNNDSPNNISMQRNAKSTITTTISSATTTKKQSSNNDSNDNYLHHNQHQHHYHDDSQKLRGEKTITSDIMDDNGL